MASRITCGSQCQLTKPSSEGKINRSSEALTDDPRVSDRTRATESCGWIWKGVASPSYPERDIQPHIPVIDRQPQTRGHFTPRRVPLRAHGECLLLSRRETAALSRSAAQQYGQPLFLDRSAMPRLPTKEIMYLSYSERFPILSLDHLRRSQWLAGMSFPMHTGAKGITIIIVREKH